MCFVPCMTFVVWGWSGLCKLSTRYFFTPLRYVRNVAKRSIWDQCKKKYILRTDPPTDRPHIAVVALRLQGHVTVTDVRYLMKSNLPPGFLMWELKAERWAVHPLLSSLPPLHPSTLVYKPKSYTNCAAVGQNYRVHKKCLELCVTITVHRLYGEKFPFALL